MGMELCVGEVPLPFYHFWSGHEDVLAYCFKNGFKKDWIPKEGRIDKAWYEIDDRLHTTAPLITRDQNLIIFEDDEEDEIVHEIYINSLFENCWHDDNHDYYFQTRIPPKYYMLYKERSDRTPRHLSVWNGPDAQRWGGKQFSKERTEIHKTCLDAPLDSAVVVIASNIKRDWRFESIETEKNFDIKRLKLNAHGFIPHHKPSRIIRHFPSNEEKEYIGFTIDLLTKVIYEGKELEMQMPDSRTENSLSATFFK